MQNISWLFPFGNDFSLLLFDNKVSNPESDKSDKFKSPITDDSSFTLSIADERKFLNDL